jgi:Leucine-rich repeat (LRR) protein
MGNNSYRSFSLLLLVLSLGSCADYEISVNDRRVYTPLPLFSNFSLADPALQTCVSQTISDEKITSVESLEKLNCSHAGIRSVEGLEQFTHLQFLNLGQNQLRNVGSLSLLTQLQRVNLDGNPALDCASVDNWQTPPELTLPPHCS